MRIFHSVLWLTKVDFAFLSFDLYEGSKHCQVSIPIKMCHLYKTIFFVTLKRMTVPTRRSLTGMVSISPYTMAPGKSGRSYCREIHSPHCIWSGQTHPGHSRSCWEVWTLTQCYWWNRTGRLYVFCIKGTGMPEYKSEWGVWSHLYSAFKSILTITQGKKIFFYYISNSYNKKNFNFVCF